jgi:probable rRNA maturation factor
VHFVVVVIAVDGDGIHAQSLAGAGDAGGNFAAIGDQNLLEHGARSLPEGAPPGHAEARAFGEPLAIYGLTPAPARTKLARVSVWIARQDVPESPIRSPALRRRAERMLARLKLRRVELSIVLCDDRSIHSLNRRHRRKDKPTDVLAFALREGQPMAGAEHVLGDVVISLDTARRQAAEHGHSLWREVTLLLAHGLLHLVGYDHRTDAEEARMNAKVVELVNAATARAARMTRPRVDKTRERIVQTSRRAPRRSAVRAKK